MSKCVRGIQPINRLLFIINLSQITDMICSLYITYIENKIITNSDIMIPLFSLSI